MDSRNKSERFITLSGNEIKNEIISCTGEQLVIILECLGECIYDLKWYAADVFLNHELPNIPANSESDLFLVGSTNELKYFCTQVDQFLSGVFIGFSLSQEIPSYQQPISTDGNQTKIFENSVMEIRAYDTTFFEIYSSKNSIVEELKLKLK